MAVAIKPLEDRIVVKANEAETTTASGLVIPDTAKEKPQEGTVVAVGPSRFDDGVRVPMDVKVGDVVEVKDTSKQAVTVLESIALAERDVPEYYEVDHSKMTAKYMRVPHATEVPYPVQMEPNLVIEFYSR